MEGVVLAERKIFKIREKRPQFGSDLATDQPLTDAKWIGPQAKFYGFCPHKDRRWADFRTHFRPHMDRTFDGI